MSLERVAWRIAGPIDAAINLAINALIPWYFLRGAEPVPLVGLPSLYAFVGPMVFCALLIASAMGFRNGIRYVTGGQMPSHWWRRAWFRGLLLACAGSAALALAIGVLRFVQPELRFSPLSVVVIDGVGAAILGYFAQAGGIFAARRQLAAVAASER